MKERILYSLIPFLSWLLITLPLWLSPFHPAIVAYFIIAFDLYFFYKSTTTIIKAVFSYREILFHKKIDYNKRLMKIKKINQINHFIIIPNYKEPLSKLKSTINAIAKNDYQPKNFYLVLAFEKREKRGNC